MRHTFNLVMVMVSLGVLFQAMPARAERLFSPALSLPADAAHPRVAVTFDACMGKTDMRILNLLVEQRIKATIFVTARWLARNAEALAVLKAHPDLFQIENHGARHLAAVDWPTQVFGVRAAGSPAALKAEIEDGASAILAATGHAPTWYRGATAEYSSGAETMIRDLGFRLAGFSVAGDGGAQFSASRTAKAFASAKDGDVIIAHINQPLRPAGAGVVEGLLALKAKGFAFVTLREGFASVTAVGAPVPRRPQYHPRRHIGH